MDRSKILDRDLDLWGRTTDPSRGTKEAVAQQMIESRPRDGDHRKPPSVPEERLRRWLGLLRQPDKLASQELQELLRAHGLLPEHPSPLAIGQAGAQLLINAIERLRPKEDATREEALPHEVLNRCFIEGSKLFQAAAVLGLSERQLSRERSRAIKLLKAELESIPREIPGRDCLPDPIPAIRGFLERPAETRKLERALAVPGLTVVHGPPGIGKTSLVAEVVSKNAESMPVLWYRFRPGVNTSLPAILFEIGDHLRSTGIPDLSDYLRNTLPSVDTSIATRLAIRILGNGPRVIAFDDYQLVEEEPDVKGLIEEMVHRIPDLRVVAVSQHRYLGMVEGTAIEVGPLTRLQAGKLLEKLAVTCDGKMVRALHAWTDGNPNMLKLAASWLRSATPEQVAEGVESLRDATEVQDFLLSQVANLIDPDDRIILDGASIFRSQFNDDALAFVTGRTRGAVMDSSMRLVRSYMATRNREGSSAFFHNSVREFIYDRIDPSLRSELHERAAQWFERASNPKESAYHAEKARASVEL